MAPPICDAVRRLYEASGLTQAGFAARLGTSQQAVQRWCTSQEPKLDDLAHIERSFDLPLGTLLRDAGYVAEVVTVQEAIRAAAGVSLEAKELLIATYEAALRQGIEGDS